MDEKTRVPVPGRAGSIVSRAVRGVAGLLVLAAGAGITAVLVTTRPEAPRVSRPDPLLQVRTLPASAADMPRVWEGYGTVRAMVVADIPAQVGGVITERPSGIEPGLPIGPPPEGRDPGMPAEGPLDAEAYLRAIRGIVGDALIVQIDPTDYVSRLASALGQAEATRAQLAGLDATEIRLLEMVELARQEREIQERELGRIVEASQLGGGNESEIERRRATLLLAQRNETSLLEQLDRIGPSRTETRARLDEQMAAIELARLNVARTVVTSPIAGTIQEVAYRAGEWAAPGSMIARVVDLSRVEVPLRVPAGAGASIAVGDVATLRVDSQGGATWEGVVSRLAPEVDPQTRSFTVFVEVEQDAGGPGPLLRPGQFVVGRITTGVSWPVLLVPRRAVEEDHVFIAADPGPNAAVGARVARRVAVETLFYVVGKRPDLDAVETQWCAARPGLGLGAGDRVIVSHLDDLHDGLMVGIGGGGAGSSSVGAAAAAGDREAPTP